MLEPWRPFRVAHAPSEPRLEPPTGSDGEDAAAPPPPPTPEMLPGRLRKRLPLAGSAGVDLVEVAGDARRISLTARDAPLSQVLSVLAQSQGLNIVHGDSLNATISITLEDVGVEQALTAMLAVNGYTWARQNDIIYVTSLASAKILPAELQGRKLQVFQLDYVSAAIVNEAVQGLLSPAGKTYSYDILPGDNRRTQEYIVVEDVPSVLQRIAEYLAQIDIPPRQVLIEAHILQVGLTDDLRHGINFNHMFNADGTKVTLETKAFADPTAAQAFFATIEGSSLEGLIETLQTTTDAKTLASPRLLILNGQLARLQVGEQLGFRVVTVTETSSLENIEFLDVGVVLSVTPRISRDNRIVMNVKPKISTGAVNPTTGLPEEDTTEVETDLILDDGQGMIIGGLIQERDLVRQNKVPILGDVWLVGKLFQHSEVNKSRTEIIVALVPRLLPYDLATAKRHAEETVRVNTPLFHGPLHRASRPWEPVLPDANPHGRAGRLPRLDPRHYQHQNGPFP